MHALRTAQFGGCSLAIVWLCAWGVGATPAGAHESPLGCSGNQVNLNMSRAPPIVANGGTVTYEVSISNRDDPTFGIIACDVEDVTVAFFCPGSDGMPDLANPVVLATDLNVPGGTVPMLVGGSETCTVDVSPGVLAATALAIAGDQDGPIDDLSQGRVHDGTVDHAFRSTQELDTFIVTTTSTTSTTLPVVCRSPRFWASHAEAGPRRRGSQDVTGAFLPVTVCGVLVADTDVGSPASALEALCVGPSDGARLELVRQLTAARLNCNVTGCPPTLLDAFDGCEMACIADTDAEMIDACIEDVRAFNTGASPDASACDDRPIPGFETTAPGGSWRDCVRARKNELTIVP